jgi:hypothetical protein
MDYDEPISFYVPEFDQEYDVSSFFSCSNNTNDDTTRISLEMRFWKVNH